jgi:hypothetical protein
MPIKRYKAEPIVTMLRQIEVSILLPRTLHRTTTPFPA